MKLISQLRNDLNSSPALGRDAVYIGGESGEMFSVPYEWCLRPANAGDTRCTTTSPPYPDGAKLEWVNAFGDTQPAAPSSMPGNAPITLIFSLREKGAQQLAILDSASVQATVEPSAEVSVDVSGDGKFLSITPAVAFPPGALTVTVHADYLINLQRQGLRLSGGLVGGSVDATFSTTVSAPSGGAMDPTATYELSRLSMPLPTVLPSYNQIGFDQLRYLLGTVAVTGNTGLVWMVGGVLPQGKTASIVDPTTQAIFPMAVDLTNDLATLTTASGIQVTVTSFTLPLQDFRVALGFESGGAASGTAELTASAVCGKIGFYGLFLQQLGLCNPQTDVIRVLGAANTAKRNDLERPPAAGKVTFSSSAAGITATIEGSVVKPSEHLVGLLAADANTGLPVPLQYGTGTTRTTAADGTIATVTVPTADVTLPATTNVYLMIDTTVGARGAL
jgi:hypothetical protein